MPGILAFTILVCYYAFAELVAFKTKATFSMILVFGIALLLSFWCGLPGEIFDASALVPIGGIVIGILITGMGNLLDFAELKRQWRTVAVATITVCIATGAVAVVGQFFLGRDLALAGAPIFAGSSTASLVMTQALNEQGRDTLSLFVVMMLVFQQFIGIPVCSFLLKKAARTFLGNEAEYNLYLTAPDEEEVSTTGKRKPLELPEMFKGSAMSMAKLGIVSVFSYYLSELTDGTVNYIVLTLVMGTVFTEYGFLEKKCLENTNANGFILFACTVLIFVNLPNATPSQLMELLFPLGVTLCIGVSGACISGGIVGKIFKVEPYMAMCMCLTCTFGFPTTMFMSNEVAKAIATTPDQEEVLGNYLRPKMITAGFITGIISIILAGWVAEFI